jgi:hypothetical protein
MVKRCPFGGRCWRSSCSIFYVSSGDVGCCPRHLNPFGFFTLRKVKPAIHHGVFDKVR